MLTKEEREELERLKKDTDVKLARRHEVDKEKRYLYRLRNLKKKGVALRKANE